MTRDFLQEADAIVWVFAIGQAAKATEKATLESAHGAGKRVLGVLNKVDRADASESTPSSATSPARSEISSRPSSRSPPPGPPPRAPPANPTPR